MKAALAKSRPTPWFNESAVANKRPPVNGMPRSSVPPPPRFQGYHYGVIAAIPANFAIAHDEEGKAAAQKGAH